MHLRRLYKGVFAVFMGFITGAAKLFYLPIYFSLYTKFFAAAARSE